MMSSKNRLSSIYWKYVLYVKSFGFKQKKSLSFLKVYVKANNDDSLKNDALLYFSQMEARMFEIIYFSSNRLNIFMLINNLI